MEERKSDPFAKFLIRTLNSTLFFCKKKKKRWQRFEECRQNFTWAYHGRKCCSAPSRKGKGEKYFYGPGSHHCLFSMINPSPLLFFPLIIEFPRIPSSIHAKVCTRKFTILARHRFYFNRIYHKSLQVSSFSRLKKNQWDFKLWGIKFSTSIPLFLHYIENFLIGKERFFWSSKSLIRWSIKIIWSGCIGRSILLAIK